jgi:5-bromo-4-chloroindolyl phosphate hydrolysis protein
LKAEVFSGLIFDETNVHKQCKKCNHFLDGNELGYRDGLINRYGIAYVLELENKKLTGRHYEYSREELEAIKQKYSKLIKDAA